MMKSDTAFTFFQKWFNKVFWPLAIFLVTLFIVLANYVPGKWLTGWDTLHPEFNFSSQIFRSVFGVWRQDQGLGTVAAHSHMSDLPRILILWLGSLVLPDHILRIGFIYLCFIVGPLGVFYFIKNGIFRKTHDFATQAAAFLGAMVYIFNLGTAQHFYVVFEMFAVQYAALGWLFLAVVNCLYSNKKKNYLILLVFSFFSAPMAYASQLWFAYFGALILFLATINLQERKIAILKKSIATIGLTIAANSFWLLPNLYFLLTDASQIPAKSHINQLFSQESFLHNANFGKIKDVAIFRNFLFNWLDLKSDGKFGDLLPQWKEHVSHLSVILIGYVTFVFSLMGIGVSFFNRKNKIAIALFPVLLLAVFMLMNMNPPFDYFFGWLRDNVSLFKEGLRTPFTKFSLLLMFVVSVYFSIFLQAIMHFMKKAGKISIAVSLTITISVSISLGFYGLPLLQGQLIEKKLINDIPQPYFRLYEWLETQPEQARIVNLPLQTSAGWEFYDWGYEGAGFIWFGMKQPMVVRDFDRWSPYNETLYKELSAALYGNDQQAFIRTLQKFDVSYLLLDKSIINPNKPTDTIKKPEIEALPDQMGSKPTWQEDFLSIYDIESLVGKKSFVYAPYSFTLAQGDTTYSERDSIYSEVGPYVSVPLLSVENNQPVIYPFSDYLKDQTPLVEYKDNKISIQRDASDLMTDAEVVLPPLAQSEYYSLQANLVFQHNLVQVSFDNKVMVEIGNAQYYLPQLPSLTLPTPSEFQTVIVEIGDKQIEIGQGQTLQKEVVLTVNEPVSLSVFSVADVREEDGQKFIDSDRIISTSLSTQVWEELTKKHRFDISPKSKITVHIFTTPYKPDFSQSDSASNCDPARRNGWIKKSTTDEGVSYQSKDLAVACDGVGLFDLSQYGSYFMRWQVENISGRGIKIYLQNLSSDRADLEELIPNETTDVTYSVLSWPLLENEGYYLSWENRSFGSAISENLIKDLEVYPVPLDFISQIRIEPENHQSLVENKVQISDLWKFGTYQYGLQANVESTNGVVVLSQGFEKGWIAFDLSGSIPKLLQKVKYNGWANAWKLTQGNHNVIIIFWPQLLEFAGLALLLTGFSITLIDSVKSYRLSKQKKDFLNGKSLKLARNTLVGKRSILE